MYALNQTVYKFNQFARTPTRLHHFFVIFEKFPCKSIDYIKWKPIALFDLISIFIIKNICAEPAADVAYAQMRATFIHPYKL